MKRWRFDEVEEGIS